MFKSVYIAFFLVISFVSFGQSSLVLSSSNPTQIEVCQTSDYYEVEIRNITTSTVSSISCTITLPTGVTYVVGSLNSSNASESNTSDLTKPVFSVNNLGLAQSSTLKIKLSASCNLMSFTNSGGVARVSAAVTYSGGSANHTSPPLNVKQPSLLISSISNQSFVGDIGDVFVREVELKNAGSGRLSMVDYRRYIQPDLLFHGSSFTNTVSGDTIYSILDSNDFKLLGNYDIYLDLNETIRIRDTFEIEGCGQLNTYYAAKWGCNGALCKTTNASASVAISNKKPNLVVSPRSYTSNCLDPTIKHPQELIFYNNGNDTARAVQADFYQAVNSGFYAYMMSEIDVTSIKYQTSRSGAYTSISPYKTEATITTGIFSCLSNGAKGSASVRLPNMAPGDSIILYWETKACCPQSCGANFYTNRWRYKASYGDQCNKSIKVPENWGSIGYLQSFRVTNLLPTDIRDGQSKTLEFRIGNGYLLQPKGSSKFEVELILPSGLTHSQTNTDLFIRHANGTVWNPTRFTQSGSSIVATFIGSPPATLHRSELLINVLGTCTNLSSNVSQNYEVNINYTPDSTCATACELNVYCSNNDIRMHCNNSCSGGLHFKDFDVRRITYGLPDNNDDGLADATGSLDFSKIKTNRIMVGDTLRSSFHGDVDNAGSTVNWYYGKASSVINYGRFLDVAGIKLKVYRIGNLLLQCNNVSYTQSAAGNSKTYTFDISTTSLNVSGCGVPANFSYTGVDSIVLEVDYVVSSNPGNAIYSLEFDNDFYLSTTSNPSSSQIYGCDEFSSRTNLVGYYFSNWGKNTFANAGCNNFSAVQNFYLSVGNCCTNYGGGNIFPFEYRQFAQLEEVILRKDPGFDVEYTHFYQYRTAGIGKTSTDIEYYIKPYSTTPTEVKYKVDSFYTSSGGNVDISDDGFHGTLRFNLLANCQADKGQSDIEYGFVYKLLGRLGPGYDTLFSNTAGDIIDYTKPSFTITPTSSLIYASQDSAVWNIRLTNTSNNAKANNVWLGAMKTPNTEMVQVKDVTTGAILQRAHDIFRLGNMDFASSRDLQVTVVYKDCNKDSVLLQVGYDCRTYPDSLSANTCTTDQRYLYFQPLNTRLESSIVDTTQYVDLCEDVSFTVEIRNTNTPHVYNPYLGITVRPGMVLGDSAWLFVDGRSDSILIDSFVPDGPNKYKWLFGNFDSLLLVNGIKGTGSTSGNFMQFRFNMTTNCDFTSNSSFLIEPGGFLGCGNPVASSYTISQPIRIKGIVTPYYSATKLNIKPFDACNYTDSTYITFINLGPDTTGSSDQIIMSTPTGILVDTTHVANLHNSPIGGAQFELKNGENTFSWVIPSGISPGDSCVLEIKTALNNVDLPCGPFQLFVQSVIQQPVVCVKDSSTCNINVATSSVIRLDTVIKGSYVPNYIAANATTKGNLEEVDLTYSIQSQGSDKLPGDDLVVSFYYDGNKNGVFDPSDSLITQDTIGQFISSNSTIQRNIVFQTSGAYLCNLLIYISDTNCVCSPTSALIPPISIKNAGNDTLICPLTPITIGLQGNPSYNYLWNNSTKVTDVDSSRTTFSSSNSVNGMHTIQMILQTSRGGCISNDTVRITLYDEMSISMADSVQMCEGGKVQIGGTATGGFGTFKQFRWSPSDSLANANARLTFANPVRDTMYYLTVTDGKSCKKTDSVVIDVVSSPVADFTFKDTCEDEQFLFINTSNFFGFANDSTHWEVGQLASGQTTNYGLRIDSAQIVPVRLYIQNQYGCFDTITKQIEAFPRPVAAIDLHSNCEGDTVLVKSAATISSGTMSHQWNVNGTLTYDTSLIVKLPFAQYQTVSLEIVSDKGCSDNINDTIFIWDKPEISLGSAENCLNDSTALNFIILAGTRDSLTTFTWDHGDGSMSASPALSHLYSDTGYYALNLIVENGFGCADTANGGATVHSLPQSAFVVSDVCKGDSTHFTDVSTIDKGTINEIYWSGTLGANKLSILEPNDGAYMMSQKVVSDKGCRDSSQQSYHVFYTPTLSISSQEECENETIFINYTGGDVDSINQLSWIIESDTMFGFGISHDFSGPGDFPIDITAISNKGCVVDSQFTKQILAKPDATIQYDLYCEDNDVLFTTNAEIANWNLGDGTTAMLDSFMHRYATIGTYNVTLHASNSNGCVDSNSTQVDIEHIVLPDFGIQNQCVGEPISVVNLTSGNKAAITQALFDMGDGIEISALDSFSYIYQVPGNYTVSLTIETAPGCTYSISKPITVYPLPYANFSLFPETADIFTADIEISDQSTGADSVFYVLSDGSSYGTRDFNHRFGDSGTYIISQKAYSPFGCIDSFSRNLYIQFAYKLFIPNSFTPNNDGLNDVFKPTGFGVKTYELDIYNRWGELIFDGAVNEPWTGADAFQGYYMYVIRAWDYQKQYYNYKGAVYLLDK